MLHSAGEPVHAPEQVSWGPSAHPSFLLGGHTYLLVSFSSLLREKLLKIEQEAELQGELPGQKLFLSSFRRDSPGPKAQQGQCAGEALSFPLHTEPTGNLLPVQLAVMVLKRSREPAKAELPFRLRRCRVRP